MSQENVELSKRVLDAWNRRDVEATIALADPEVVWHPVLEETIEGQAYRGPAGLRQYYADLAEQGVESQGELAEFRDLGDRVLGLGRLSFKSSVGVELDSEVACIWKWSDGKCVEAQTWLSHAEALEAAGLRSRRLTASQRAPFANRRSAEERRPTRDPPSSGEIFRRRPRGRV
jgi:ketosteroid isomerase-like protein